MLSGDRGKRDKLEKLEESLVGRPIVWVGIPKPEQPMPERAARVVKEIDTIVLEAQRPKGTGTLVFVNMEGPPEIFDAGTRRGRRPARGHDNDGGVQR